MSRIVDAVDLSVPLPTAIMPARHSLHSAGRGVDISWQGVNKELRRVSPSQKTYGVCR